MIHNARDRAAYLAFRLRVACDPRAYLSCAGLQYSAAELARNLPKFGSDGPGDLEGFCAQLATAAEQAEGFFELAMVSHKTLTGLDAPCVENARSVDELLLKLTEYAEVLRFRNAGVSQFADECIKRLEHTPSPRELFLAELSAQAIEAAF